VRRLLVQVYVAGKAGARINETRQRQGSAANGSCSPYFTGEGRGRNPREEARAHAGGFPQERFRSIRENEARNEARNSEISDQHAQHFAAKYAALSASRINCGLRTLRRALNLAFEWGKLERPVKITLAKGERQRDTVLTESDWERYIAECSQPWRDAAIIIRGTGMRPGEAFALRWENIYLNGTGGLIQVTEGKTKAARRMLPMVPTVYAALKARRVAAGNPEEGWLFPTSSREGHLNKDTAKDQHRRALEGANANEKGKKELKPFQPYVLRHTALTRLAEAGCDVFTLARIAGHSSITITQRYVHPQADAIERAFQQTTKAALPAGGE
jgi:integrase